MDAQLPPNAEPDVDLPMRGVPTVMMVSILGSFGALAILATVIGLLGMAGVITSAGEATMPYWIEFVVGLPLAFLFLFLLRQYMRRRLQIFATQIWFRTGLLRTTSRFVIDLADVDQIVLKASGAAQSSSLDLHFQSRTSSDAAIIRGITEYGAAGQRRLHEYLSRHAPISGRWTLGFGRYIDTGDSE